MTISYITYDYMTPIEQTVMPAITLMALLCRVVSLIPPSGPMVCSTSLYATLTTCTFTCGAHQLIEFKLLYYELQVIAAESPANS